MAAGARNHLCVGEGIRRSRHQINFVRLVSSWHIQKVIQRISEGVRVKSSHPSGNFKIKAENVIINDHRSER